MIKFLLFILIIASNRHRFVNGTNFIQSSNPCKSNPCLNNGLCVKQGKSYKCYCLKGFSGRRCKSIPLNPCLSMPCLNGGTCEQLSDLNSFKCLCKMNFFGDLCEIFSNPCQSMPCLNGGTCYNSPDFKTYICKCSTRFSGKTCSIVKNMCSSNPCLNNGICTYSAYSSTYKCDCSKEFRGKNCEKNFFVDLDSCSSNPCLNNGTCTYSSDSKIIECKCTKDFAGKRCKKNISKCIESFRDAALKRHNLYRKNHNSTQLLQNDSTISTFALNYAQNLANGSIFERNLNSLKNGYGENIYFSSISSFTSVKCIEFANSMVDNWYNQITSYSYKKPEKNNLATTGSFTQVVWKGSIFIGCGIGLKTKHNAYYAFGVCDYSPLGNIKSKFSKNVSKRLIY